VKIFSSPQYEVPLAGHVWPTAKYRLISERLGRETCEPSAASWDDLALVHTGEYLARLRDNTLTAAEIATLELPWQAGFADAFRLMVGGTIAAARAAVEDGRAAHVGGGLHHAFANHGEGFCPLNDVAVAIRVLQRAGPAEGLPVGRAAVIDLDVHHGNGTAMIFERDASVFTFSMHQQLNYPVFKPRSDLDVGLPDGTTDETYLDRLREALPQVMHSRPDLIVYLAGADPYEHDRLGGLALTKSGLLERDRVVFAAARLAGVPIATVLAGGYATNVDDTVDIHTATVRAMME
jgi:acetoin utilization deacetylase AcuC-like enzyme